MTWQSRCRRTYSPSCLHKTFSLLHFIVLRACQFCPLTNPRQQNSTDKMQKTDQLEHLLRSSSWSAYSLSLTGPAKWWLPFICLPTYFHCTDFSPKFLGTGLMRLASRKRVDPHDTIQIPAWNSDSGKRRGLSGDLTQIQIHQPAKMRANQ